MTSYEPATTRAAIASLRERDVDRDRHGRQDHAENQQLSQGFTPSTAARGRALAGSRASRRGRPRRSGLRGCPSRRRCRLRSRIESTLLTSLSSWAITKVVRPSVRTLQLSSTAEAASASSPAWGSSRIRIGVSLSMARAMEMRCLCPPLRLSPRSESGVVAFRQLPDKTVGPASSAMASISSWLAPGRP